MFDKLIEVALESWRLQPVRMEVINEWQSGLKIRAGKVVRRLEPGVHFHVGWGLEEILVMDTVPVVVESETVTCTTADDEPVAVGFSIQYEVNDVQRFYTRVQDFDSSLLNLVEGLGAESISEWNWADLRKLEDSDENSFTDSLMETVQETVTDWGVRIITLTVPTLTRADVVRWIGSPAAAEAE